MGLSIAIIHRASPYFTYTGPLFYKTYPFQFRPYILKIKHVGFLQIFFYSTVKAFA